MTHPLSTRHLLALGMAYRSLAVAFAYPAPGSEASGSDSLAEDLRASLEMLTEEGDWAAATTAVCRAASLLHTAEHSLEEEYTYLFARQAPVSPYESRYLGPLASASPHSMVDVAAFYKAFGFQVAQEANELADYVGTELEFMGLLCLKEAYAMENRWDEQAATCSAARAAFLRDHLGRWFPAFAAGLRAKARLLWYSALADLGSALLAYDQTALGVAPELVPMPQAGISSPEATPLEEGACLA